MKGRPRGPGRIEAGNDARFNRRKKNAPVVFRIRTHAKSPRILVQAAASWTTGGIEKPSHA